MSPQKFDEQVREHYSRQRLSDEGRDRIKAMIRKPRQSRSASRWWWARTGVAAVFVFVATAAALWFAVFRGNVPESPQEITAAVVRDAAEGHNQQEDLDFRAARAADLRRAMKSLDFTPVEPEIMRSMNMRLVGARYTTLQGVMAAQILYLDPKGEPCTLYQARPVDKLARISKSEHVIDGLRVSVWREKGLVMVLTRPVA
ncbi:MAG TPA: hypothetical protein VMS98_12835 [Thermoanaerobaculia bacterium]|nr:hypothetical protein [Thermoanaerobaculia bacterium]